MEGATMFKSEYPIFVHKNILKIEMLEKIRDYPRDFLDIFYQEYSDGVLEGCEVEVKEHFLLLHPGIILFHQRMYCSKEYQKIPYSATDCLMYLKIRFFDEEKEIEGVKYLSEIILSEEGINQRDEIELCRFHLEKKAKLRSEYQDFADFSTKYNTINRIYVPYAEKKMSTLWPYLLEYFAKKNMKKQKLQTEDVIFCMNILRDKKAVSRDLIITYIEKKTEKEVKDFDNYNLYLELLKILQEGSYEEKKKEQRVRKPYKIIVD